MTLKDVSDGGVNEACKQAIEAMLARGHKGWGHDFFQQGLSFSYAEIRPVPKIVFDYVCNEAHTNGMNNLHGGCTATLFDLCTTFALVPVQRAGFWQFMGVSRTLNVTYIRPIPVGEVVEIHCEIVHAGQRLAALKGEMRRKSDHAILATCDHGKVNIDPPVKSKL